MSKRKAALENAQSEDKVLDFDEVLNVDRHSLEGLLHTEKGKLMKVEKTMKSLLSNASIPLGDEFVNLFAEKEAVQHRITLINKALSYVA